MRSTQLPFKLNMLFKNKYNNLLGQKYSVTINVKFPERYFTAVSHSKQFNLWCTKLCIITLSSAVSSILTRVGKKNGWDTCKEGCIIIQGVQRHYCPHWRCSLSLEICSAFVNISWFFGALYLFILSSLVNFLKFSYHNLHALVESVVKISCRFWLVFLLIYQMV